MIAGGDICEKVLRDCYNSNLCCNNFVSFRFRVGVVMINGLSFLAITIACLAWSFVMTDYKENKK